MPISIVGNGSITGLTAGGLPDASVTNDDLATGIASSKLSGLLVFPPVVSLGLYPQQMLLRSQSTPQRMLALG